MTKLEDLYLHASTTPGDIWEHVPMLRSLAAQCNHITEMGTRYGISTVALLSGLPKRMLAYDIERHERVGMIEVAAKEAGVDFQFIQADVLCVTIEDTDLLFLDTKHTYDQILNELTFHGGHAKKYIVFHDTVSFGERGEDGGVGILPAIHRYFKPRVEWKLFAHYTNNNGLMIYTRKTTQ